MFSRESSGSASGTGGEDPNARAAYTAEEATWKRPDMGMEGLPIKISQNSF